MKVGLLKEMIDQSVDNYMIITLIMNKDRTVWTIIINNNNHPIYECTHLIIIFKSIVMDNQLGMVQTSPDRKVVQERGGKSSIWLQVIYQELKLIYSVSNIKIEGRKKQIFIQKIRITHI